jgi:H+/Cl- antiporter ClcA
MEVDLPYVIFTGLLLGVLGGLVFFVWDLINHSFHMSHAVNVAVQAGLIFAVLGFILGLIIGHLK